MLPDDADMLRGYGRTVDAPGSVGFEPAADQSGKASKKGKTVAIVSLEMVWIPEGIVCFFFF